MINPEVAVAQSLSGVWLCDPTNCSSPGSPHHLPELAQTHVHESVMPSSHLTLCHPLSSCSQSSPALVSFPVSQLFISGGQSIGASASVLPMNIQDWFPLGLTGLISMLSKGLSRVFSPAPQFESINSLVLSLPNYWKNHSFDYTDICWQSNVSAF